MRMALWLATGLVLGAIMHLSIVLAMPALSERGLWTEQVLPHPQGQFVVLDNPEPGEANPLELDPAFVTGLCRISLADGPVTFRARMPLTFWSVAVYDPTGRIAYATNGRGAANTLAMQVMTSAQLRQSGTNPAASDDRILVELPAREGFLVLRAFVEYAPQAQGYRDQLSEVDCSSG